MSRRREIPIDVTRGTYREVKIVFSDQPDLSGALDIKLIVKQFAADEAAAYEKLPDDNKSDYKNGILFFVFEPSETENLSPHTYYYELHVTLSESEKYIPIVGEFIVWG